MGNFAQAKYSIKNPEKYSGKGQPTYRSSWELTFMQFCDNNPNVISWASEPFSIPYRHPLTTKRSQYVPDFMVVYQDKSGRQIAEVVEIKPYKQSMINEKSNQRDKMIVVVNYAKWEAAQAFCKQNKLGFRVVTERDIYRK